jgi:hypothetical protein
VCELIRHRFLHEVQALTLEHGEDIRFSLPSSLFHRGSRQIEPHADAGSTGLLTRDPCGSNILYATATRIEDYELFLDHAPQQSALFAVELENITARAPAEPCCALDQSFQNELQIELCAADDFEDVGGGGLLLQ